MLLDASWRRTQKKCNRQQDPRRLRAGKENSNKHQSMQTLILQAMSRTTLTIPETRILNPRQSLSLAL